MQMLGKLGAKRYLYFIFSAAPPDLKMFLRHYKFFATGWKPHRDHKFTLMMWLEVV